MRCLFVQPVCIACIVCIVIDIIQTMYNWAVAKDNSMPDTIDTQNIKTLSNKTRAMFETSNYHRRPYDRYTTPNDKCIGAEHPSPLKKKKYEKLVFLVIGLVEKQWSHCETV